jgi:hypothetical protein
VPRHPGLAGRGVDGRDPARPPLSRVPRHPGLAGRGYDGPGPDATLLA